MSDSRFVYAPIIDATPEAESSALTNVYKFILDCRAQKEGASPGAPDNTTNVRHTEGVSHVDQRPY